MANRVTVAEVREVITTDLLDASIAAYIGIANSMVTATVTCGLDDDIMKEIERFLTAHLIAITSGNDRVTTAEKLGEAEVKYAGKYGEGLKSTQYGQMVLALDTCGAFANLGKKSATMRAITSFES